VLVVLDANVFVSAAIQRGASYRIVQVWLTGTASFEVVMCPALLAEIRDVLTTRPRLRKWISLETASLFVGTIGTLVDLVDDPAQIDTATCDSDDDYLIALARENGAELIVSGDKDLLDWESQRPPVITPSEFEQRIRTD
jgi:putative PIN family toxin of toxin-antitoxin system